MGTATKMTIYRLWKLAQNDIYNYGNWHKIDNSLAKMTFTSIDPGTKV